jgi:hypothetical protein
VCVSCCHLENQPYNFCDRSLLDPLRVLVIKRSITHQWVLMAADFAADGKASLRQACFKDLTTHDCRQVDQPSRHDEIDKLIAAIEYNESI